MLLYHIECKVEKIRFCNSSHKLRVDSVIYIGLSTEFLVNKTNFQQVCHCECEI